MDTIKKHPTSLHFLFCAAMTSKFSNQNYSGWLAFLIALMPDQANISYKCDRPVVIDGAFGVAGDTLCFEGLNGLLVFEWKELGHHAPVECRLKSVADSKRIVGCHHRVALLGIRVKGWIEEEIALAIDLA